MSSREQILSAVKQNKPALKPMPEVNLATQFNVPEKRDIFIKTLETIGGKVIPISDYTALAEVIADYRKTGKYVVNTIPEAGEVNPEIDAETPDTTMETVDFAIVRGTLGVAENGSVWVYESAMVNRLLPFATQQLALVLEADKIVGDMHVAYKTIDVAKEGFGAFIAGPSKTADIEQSLVIGAHGPRTMTLYLVG